MAKSINLTPTRMRVLEYLASKPSGVYVSGLADEVIGAARKDAQKRRFKRQQATRLGAACAAPLVRAGLLRKIETDYGWGMVALTEAGRAALRAHQAANDPSQMSLEAVLAKCEEK
jgi:DNA-binding MarR family transcriptional regulator